MNKPGKIFGTSAGESHQHNHDKLARHDSVPRQTKLQTAVSVHERFLEANLSACIRSMAWRTLVLSQASSCRWDNGFLSDMTFIEFPGGTEVHRGCSSGAALNCAATLNTTTLVNWPACEGQEER